MICCLVADVIVGFIGPSSTISIQLFPELAGIILLRLKDEQIDYSVIELKAMNLVVMIFNPPSTSHWA